MSNPSGSQPSRPEKALPSTPSAQEEACPPAGTRREGFVLDNSDDEDSEEFDVINSVHAKGVCPIYLALFGGRLLWRVRRMSSPDLFPPFSFSPKD
jgi:hypothetical protein